VTTKYQNCTITMCNYCAICCKTFNSNFN